MFAISKFGFVLCFSGGQISALPQQKTTTPVESTPNSQPTTSKQHEWLKISERWREKLKDLHNSFEQNVFSQIGSLKYVDNETFRIGEGRDGTEVFLGLRDDGTEVAIKRIKKSKYDVLKKEKQFLRLPKLHYHDNIVRYIDFAEDAKCGYLALQLCEYTLEEHIQKLNKEAPEVHKTLIQQILRGLSALHGQKPQILHRDLKPQNVLIGKKTTK